MKKSKKLMILGLSLATGAVAATSTVSSFAWFSMNNQVTTSGMKISAKNESGSLIIGAMTYSGTTGTAPKLDAVQSANLTSIDLSLTDYNYTTDFSVKPVQHADKSIIADLDSPANWSYKVADLPSNYASTKTATPLDSKTGFAGYVITYDLYITVAKGSPAMKDLKCNATIQASETQAVRDAVRVLVASDAAAEEFYNAHTEGTVSTTAHVEGTTVLADSIVNSALTHVKAYIYIDGEDASIYTNNFTNLKEATISLSFTAAEADA